MHAIIINVEINYFVVIVRAILTPFKTRYHELSCNVNMNFQLSSTRESWNRTMFDLMPYLTLEYDQKEIYKTDMMSWNNDYLRLQYRNSELWSHFLLFQTVSVSVSVLTLTSISFERYFAICYPLKFINSTRKATATIILIWGVAMLAAIPDLLYMSIKPYFTGQYSYLPFLIACMMQWNANSIKIYQIIQMIVFYFLPMGLMGFAYLEIAQRLWTNVVPGNGDSCKYPSKSFTFLASISYRC